MTAAASPPDDPSTRSWSVGKVLAIAAIVSMVIFWIWVLSGAPDRHSADYLADRAYVTRVSNYCKASEAERAKLPRAEQTPKVADRANSVDRATASLTTMVDKIEKDLPDNASDRRVVKLWVADWRVYLQNRRDYTARLRHDPRARFLVSVKPQANNDSYDTVIQAFAEANNIPECSPPTDLA